MRYESFSTCFTFFDQKYEFHWKCQLMRLFGKIPRTQYAYLWDFFRIFLEIFCLISWHPRVYLIRTTWCYDISSYWYRNHNFLLLPSRSSFGNIHRLNLQKAILYIITPINNKIIRRLILWREFYWIFSFHSSR